jgi:hypothetical protein
MKTSKVLIFLRTLASAAAIALVFGLVLAGCASTPANSDEAGFIAVGKEVPAGVDLKQGYNTVKGSSKFLGLTSVAGLLCRSTTARL